jgi:hypothetical protein
LEAGILIGSPVRGLRPVVAERVAETVNVPKPTRRTCVALFQAGFDRVDYGVNSFRCFGFWKCLSFCGDFGNEVLLVHGNPRSKKS